MSTTTETGKPKRARRGTVKIEAAAARAAPIASTLPEPSSHPSAEGTVAGLLWRIKMHGEAAFRAWITDVWGRGGYHGYHLIQALEGSDAVYRAEKLLTAAVEAGWLSPSPKGSAPEPSQAFLGVGGGPAKRGKLWGEASSTLFFFSAVVDSRTLIDYLFAGSEFYAETVAHYCGAEAIDADDVPVFEAAKPLSSEAVEAMRGPVAATAPHRRIRATRKPVAFAKCPHAGPYRVVRPAIVGKAGLMVRALHVVCTRCGGAKRGDLKWGEQTAKHTFEGARLLLVGDPLTSLAEAERLAAAPACPRCLGVEPGIAFEGTPSDEVFGELCTACAEVFPARDAVEAATVGTAPAAAVAPVEPVVASDTPKKPRGPKPKPFAELPLDVEIVHRVSGAKQTVTITDRWGGPAGKCRPRRLVTEPGIRGAMVFCEKSGDGIGGSSKWAISVESMRALWLDPDLRVERQPREGSGRSRLESRSSQLTIEGCA